MSQQLFGRALPRLLSAVLIGSLVAAGLVTSSRSEAAAATPSSSVTQAISAAGHAVSQPSLTMSPDGTSAIVWLQDDAGGDAQVWASIRAGGAPWSEPIAISQDSHPALQPEVVIGSDEVVHVGWGASGGVWARTIEVVPAGQAPGFQLGPVEPVVTAPDSIGHVSAMRAGSDGLVFAAAALEDVGTGALTGSYLKRRPGSPWSVLDSVGPVSEPPSLEYQDASTLNAAWVAAGSSDEFWWEQVGASGWRGSPERVVTSSYLRSPRVVYPYLSKRSAYVIFSNQGSTTVAAGSYSANYPNGPRWLTFLGISNLGARDLQVFPGDTSSLAVWIESDKAGGEQVAAHHLGYDWGDSFGPKGVLPGATGLSDARAAAASWQGRLAVAWADSTSTDLNLTVGSVENGAWVWDPAITIDSPPATDVSDVRVATRDRPRSVSSSPDLVVSWIATDGVPRLFATTVDGSGPWVAMTAPASSRVTAGATDVAWAASDASGIGSVHLQVSTTSFDGDAGTFTELADPEPGSSTTVPVEPGHTYCFRIRAVDTIGNESISLPRCTTSPVDDRALIASSGWANKSGRGFFQHTYRQSSARGERLRLKGVHGQSLALVVAKGPHYGKIRVTFGKRLLGVFGLARSTRRSKVFIPLTSYNPGSVGLLKITVVSSGKPVKIDGVLVCR